MSDLYLGIDGGGTRCRARLADAGGQVIGEGEAGPANIYRNAEAAWANVLLATRDALEAGGLSSDALGTIHAGLGLAGAIGPAIEARILERPHPFASLRLLSDAHAAVLGAFGGGDGAVLILGTGSVGMVLQERRFSSVGGLGFPASDHGSGAWLGLKALREALLALDRLRGHTPLTEAVLDAIGREHAEIIRWQERAQPQQFAALAPLAFEAAAAGDELATRLLRETAREAEVMLDCLAQLGGRRTVLLGGLAPGLRPYLSSGACESLSEPAGDALDGALLMARAGIGRTP